MEGKGYRFTKSYRPTPRPVKGLTVSSLLLSLLLLLLAAPTTAPAATLPGSDFGRAEENFLNELERRAILYFVEQTNPDSGLTHDRAPADGGASEAPASVAASGFALSAWGIAADRGWLPRALAKRQVVTCLRFVLEKVEHERGWLYHFVDIHSGKRMWNCEASTIDTALFLQGAIFAREYFKDPEIEELVGKLYRRIDWTWALNGGKTLSHGWLPESGFIPYRWDSYAEMLGLYLLGIGAPGKALASDTWHSWRREPVLNYAGRTFIHAGPLFTHQYSHAWFDFRGRRDAYADYWSNSVDATLAQRQWCADRSTRFPLWSLELWGLTASDSAEGYVAWGGPSGSENTLDGTVVPCAPGGSLPFAPRECLKVLFKMREIGGEKVWKRYGFVDAFNPHTGWAAQDVIAIDQGIMLVMAENLRSGLVWDAFMKSPEVRRGLRLAGFEDKKQDANAKLVLASLR